MRFGLPWKNIRQKESLLFRVEALCYCEIRTLGCWFFIPRVVIAVSFIMNFPSSGEEERL